MIEIVGPLAGFALSVIIGAVGYGRLRQSVISAKETSDERHELVTREISALKMEQSKDSEAFTTIKVDLSAIKADVKNLNDNFTEWKRRIL